MILSYQQRSEQVCKGSFKVLLGSFGRVRLCRNRKTGEYFAMKILKKADIIKLKQVDHVISENTILADIDHPFLVIIFIFHQIFYQVGLKGFSQDARYLYFLMDYIPGGELFTYLRSEGKLEPDHAMYEISVQTK